MCILYLFISTQNTKCIIDKMSIKWINSLKTPTIIGLKTKNFEKIPNKSLKFRTCMNRT